MMRKLKEHLLWRLFKEQSKKNTCFLILMFFFNICASILEGISFSVVLLGLTFISGDALSPSFLSKWLLAFANESDRHLLFIYFISLAILLQICRSLFSYFGQLMTSILVQNFQKKTQEKIYDQIFKFSFRHVSTYKIGDLIHHASTPPNIFPIIFDGANRVIISALMMTGYICILGTISLRLTAVVTLLFLVFLFVQKGIIKKIKKSSEIFTKETVELSKETNQYFNGFRIIHLFNRQADILKKIETILSRVSSSTLKLNLWNNLVSPINEGMGIFLSGITLILGFVFLKDSTHAILPTLLTFVMIIYRFGTRLQVMMQGLGAIASNMGFISRMKSILDSEDKDYYPQIHKNCESFSKELSFNNVSFIYSGKTSETISNLSFSISRGKSVALVGHSGAGKSTILDLLLRLYEPSQGQILLDDANARGFNTMSWRNLFGVVSQDTFLLHDTIEENIRFGKGEASFKEIKEAAQVAGADSFIQHLPSGYKTVIGEKGFRLSGGEKQRLALARAIIRNPEILVLDEATSNLDSHSETFIQKALENLSQTKTLVIVAHRLSSIIFADQILVLNDGRIVERGTHQELLVKKGTYHNLWNLQLGNRL